MTAAPSGTELPAEVAAELDRLRPCDVVVALLTYNNADTVKAVTATAVAGVKAHLDGSAVAFVDADAGSADGTEALIRETAQPCVTLHHDSSPGERVTVPFHGVPGRGAALRGAFEAAHRAQARAVVVLEPDVVSMTENWIAALVRPLLDKGADLVSPIYARHRYDSTITNLIMSPLVRALYGRRLHRPFAGQLALSGRLVEHLLIHPRWDWTGPDVTDLWIVGTAIADGFAVWESWLGPRRVSSRTRTSDLPTMVAQTLGSMFAVMDRHEDLWLETRGSEPLPALGTPTLPSIEPMEVDVEQMLDAFRLGVRDLTGIWECVLAPDTLSEVLGLEAATRFSFPDDLWARVVYDFALGHHYGIVYRDHLLRSLVPLYLGKTAAFVLATDGRSAQASEALTDAVGAAFERQKAYLVERWR